MTMAMTVLMMKMLVVMLDGDVDVSDDLDENNDDNDSDNDDDNDDDDVVAGGYQQHVPSNLNYFDLRLCRDVPLFFEGSRHTGNEN